MKLCRNWLSQIRKSEFRFLSCWTSSWAPGDLYLYVMRNQFLYLVLSQSLMYLISLPYNSSLCTTFFFSFWGDWWLLSLAAAALIFIWICNQEAVILPESVWSTIFTQYKLSSLWSYSRLQKGFALLCPVFYRLSPAVGENQPLWFTSPGASWPT